MKILCANPAMPVHPDCCDPIHILIAGRIGQFGGVAGALADASHPDLPILERRRQRQDCIGIVRAGCQDQRIVHDQRDLEAGGRVPALRPGRWIGRREHRRNQVLSRSAGRPSFTRETSPCLETVRPFACPMTERNRWNPGGSISNLITFPWIILIGERRRPDRYEQRGQRACTPETFFARA